MRSVAPLVVKGFNYSIARRLWVPAGIFFIGSFQVPQLPHQSVIPNSQRCTCEWFVHLSMLSCRLKWRLSSSFLSAGLENEWRDYFHKPCKHHIKFWTLSSYLTSALFATTTPPPHPHPPRLPPPAPTTWLCVCLDPAEFPPQCDVLGGHQNHVHPHLAARDSAEDHLQQALTATDGELLLSKLTLSLSSPKSTVIKRLNETHRPLHTPSSLPLDSHCFILHYENK